MKKYNINLSVALNKAIEPLIKQNYKLCRIQEKDGYLLFFQDADERNGFYFGIVKEASDGTNGHNVHIKLKPASATNTNANSSTIKIDKVVEVLRYWFSYIAYYQQDSILNDPILTDYKKKFYDDFTIVDDDANYSPFNYDQQLLLNQFLNNVISNITQIQDDGNKEIVDDIITETITLQGQLTSETKNGFMNKLSFIFAKARKGGLKISEFVLKEFAKEFLKDSAKFSFDFAVNHSHEISKYVKTLINVM